jgi:hypothetical protein
MLKTFADSLDENLMKISMITMSAIIPAVTHTKHHLENDFVYHLTIITFYSALTRVKVNQRYSWFNVINAIYIHV